MIGKTYRKGKGPVDELKISSKLMRTMISKLLSKMECKKLGYKADIHLNELRVSISDQVAHIHINADAEMDTKEFKKFEKLIENAES